jgi:hypothetical protein
VEGGRLASSQSPRREGVIIYLDLYTSVLAGVIGIMMIKQWMQGFFNMFKSAPIISADHNIGLSVGAPC